MRIFISYAHDDMPFCKQFVKLLDAHEVWFDQNLRGGEEWWQRILERLNWCEALIFLLSPVSVQSEYCNREAKIAITSEKIIIPVIVNRKTNVPAYLSHIQYINLSDGLDGVDNILQLMNALFVAERSVYARKDSFRLFDFASLKMKPPTIKQNKESLTIRNLPYNYIYRLDQKNLSESTKYVYMKWPCDYLEKIAGFTHIPSNERHIILSKLSVSELQQSFSVGQINAWLGMLKLAGVSKLSVAKAAILMFVEILAEDQILDKDLVQKIRAIEAYKLDFDKRPRRYLKYEEIIALQSVYDSNSSLSIRNAAIISLLMMFRTGEVIKLCWKDVSIHNEKVTIRNPINNNYITIPESLQEYIVKWHQVLLKHENDTSLAETFVIRRFIHGDHIQKNDVSSSSLREVLLNAATKANIGKLNPDDLRISVRLVMEQKGRELF